MANTAVKTPIGYKRDFDQLATHESLKYRVNDPSGQAEYLVPLAKTNSVEFFIRETSDKLDEVATAGAGAAWPAAKRFTELGRVCKNRFLQSFRKFLAADYSTNADKTVANFKEIKKDMITDVYGTRNPGNQLKTYMQTKVKYSLCFAADTGLRERPTDYHARLLEMVECGEAMHHSMAAELFTEDEFKLFFWNSFPDDMRNWLTNTQRMDPYDEDEPFDAQVIANELERYWNIHFQNAKPKRGRDDDDDQSRNTRRRGNGDGRYNNNNNGGRRGNRKNGGGAPQGDVCPIPGHANYRHSWQNCFLNPRSRNFNARDAERFHETACQPGSPCAWYRDVWEKRTRGGGSSQQSYYSGGGSTYSQGRGRGFGGRGGGWRGRGRGRGRGGGRSNYSTNEGTQYSFQAPAPVPVQLVQAVPTQNQNMGLSYYASSASEAPRNVPGSVFVPVAPQGGNVSTLGGSASSYTRLR